MTEAAQTQQTTETQAQDSFAIPQEYSDRTWTKTIKSSDDLWKTLDNVQSLIGKRPAGIPAADAPEADWEKFYNAAGRPEAADKYNLPDIEGLPEGVDLAPYKTQAAELFYKAGLTQKQSEAVWKSYLELEKGTAAKGTEAFKAQQAELDKQFDELTGKLFGDKYDDVSQRAQAFISGALPDELKPVIEEVAQNPKALVAMIKVADYAQNEIAAIKAKYAGEDGLTSGAQTSGESKDEIVKKLTEANLLAKKSSPFSPERKEAEENVKKYREQLARFFK